MQDQSFKDVDTTIQSIQESESIQELSVHDENNIEMISAKLNR